MAVLNSENIKLLNEFSDICSDLGISFNDEFYKLIKNYIDLKLEYCDKRLLVIKKIVLLGGKGGKKTPRLRK